MLILKKATKSVFVVSFMNTHLLERITLRGDNFESIL